jgi:hypothetical protein
MFIPPQRLPVMDFRVIHDGHMLWDRRCECNPCPPRAIPPPSRRGTPRGCPERGHAACCRRGAPTTRSAMPTGRAPTRGAPTTRSAMPTGRAPTRGAPTTRSAMPTGRAPTRGAPTTHQKNGEKVAFQSHKRAKGCMSLGKNSFSEMKPSPPVFPFDDEISHGKSICYVFRWALNEPLF